MNAAPFAESTVERAGEIGQQIGRSQLAIQVVEWIKLHSAEIPDYAALELVDILRGKQT